MKRKFVIAASWLAALVAMARVARADDGDLFAPTRSDVGGAEEQAEIRDAPPGSTPRESPPDADRARFRGTIGVPIAGVPLSGISIERAGPAVRFEGWKVGGGPSFFSADLDLFGLEYGRSNGVFLRVFGTSASLAHGSGEPFAGGATSSVSTALFGRFHAPAVGVRSTRGSWTFKASLDPSVALAYVQGSVIAGGGRFGDVQTAAAFHTTGAFFSFDLDLTNCFGQKWRSCVGVSPILFDASAAGFTPFAGARLAFGGEFPL